MGMLPNLEAPFHPVEPTVENLDELEADRRLGEGMLAGYVRQWEAHDSTRWEILDVETAFLVPVVNPDSERASRYFDRAGILDLRVRDRETGLIYIADHKTAAPGSFSEFRNHLALDEQITGYLVADQFLRPEAPAAGFLYNVLVKQIPKPPRLLKAKKKADAHGGLSQAKDQVTTPEMYRAEIAKHGLDEADYVEILSHLETNRRTFFQRELVTRTPEQMREYMVDLYEDSRTMRDARPRKHVSMFTCPRCPFRQLCISDTPEIRETFDVADNPHWEIEDEIVDGTKKDVLSYSRIRAFHECPQKHQYHYVEGLKPKTESRALRFGSGIHLALKSWYIGMRDGHQVDPVAVWLEWFDREHERLTGEKPDRTRFLREELPF